MSFLFGAVIGSFTNCFVWRLHENETLLDRSYCPKCRKLIAWFDNIPVISFLLLRGQMPAMPEKKFPGNIRWWNSQPLAFFRFHSISWPKISARPIFPIIILLTGFR